MTIVIHDEPNIVMMQVLNLLFQIMDMEIFPFDGKVHTIQEDKP
jgi:hypothetical protein